MKPVIYAVQYRSFHTAIHHYALFWNKAHAEVFRDEMMIESEFPPESYDWIKGDIEIDYRRPPTTYHTPGMRLECDIVCVNADGPVPDFYW